MNSEKKQLVHGLSDGRGVFWALRSLLVPGRDIDFTAEQGIFEPEVKEDDLKCHARDDAQLKRSERRVVYESYRDGGQVIPLYVKTRGTQFAARV